MTHPQRSEQVREDPCHRGEHEDGHEPRQPPSRNVTHPNPRESNLYAPQLLQSAPVGTHALPHVRGRVRLTISCRRGSAPRPDWRACAGELADGRLLTNAGYRHTAPLNPSSCVDEHESRYYIDGALPRPGTRCDQDAPP
ncbi:alpha/beta hydrolase [Streptomyces sp. NBC_00358]|uniref:alpha/beta hydrolase n=1 Tax=Streptomyces sp. NBC_00358 TaxID=2975725 RepID=UPI002E25AF9B